MQKTKYSKDHPVVAFIALLAFFVFLDFYLSAIPSAKQAQNYLIVVKTLSKIFPEGEPYYTKSVQSVSYVLSKAMQKQVKDPIAYAVKFGEVSPLLWSWASKYLLVFGAIYGFFYKLGIFVLLSPLVLGGVLLAKHLDRLKPYLMYLKAVWIAPLKDWDVIRLVVLHLSNPVPASIAHHNPKEGGLLDHSLRVCRCALREGEGLNKKLLVLASLLHDVGKIKLYRKEKFQSVSAPSPVVVKPKTKGGWRWVSLQVNQKVVNFVSIREISKRFKLPEIPEEVWKVVRACDKKAVEEELRQGLFKVSHLTKEVLASLEYFKDKKDGWRKGRYVFVLASSFNRKLSRLLLQEDPLLEIDTEPTQRGVHVIAYSVAKSEDLVREVEGKKADDLGLFDLKVKGTVFRAVYCFDLSKIEIDIPQMYKDEEIEVLERDGAGLQKEKAESAKE